jgi:presenilin-like A22 family membrane protease
MSCAYTLKISETELYAITPFPESPAGSLGNALYFVILLCFGATIIFLLLEKRIYKPITLITGFALMSVTFFLSMVYFNAFSKVFALISNETRFIVSTAVTLATGYVILGTKSKTGGFLTLLLSGALGAFLGASVQTLSAMLILCFLAVYDIFTVYRGPVGKIANAGLERFRGLIFSFRDIQIGFGDLTFYSMLVGHILFYFGLLQCLASLAGVLLGCFLTIKLLGRYGTFPGLPIPIFLGLALGFFTAPS